MILTCAACGIIGLILGAVVSTICVSKATIGKIWIYNGEEKDILKMELDCDPHEILNKNFVCLSVKESSQEKQAL